MRLALRPHPDTPSEAVSRIDVEATRRGRDLVLAYEVFGDITALVLAPPGPPERTDELWRTTCFEAFVGRVGDDGYAEFNLAPSTRWAAYRFTGYREGMADLAIETPRIALTPGEGRLVVAATVTVPLEGDWRLGLTAVIEEASGRKSYWALAHAPGRPDFHQAAGFAAILPPTEL
ncbi:MAG TPA: DOMON-like domain-containing protein [Caulobacteraceae bacterium]|nr:DOMON-like domain-containing protein [Caulobacteraceae bacterium]